jgi:Zn ribbon nucleic-acid-binding protein
MAELREAIAEILNNNDLEITFTSPDDLYSITYSTSIVAKEVIDPSSWSRTYWMCDKKVGSEATSPWDHYSHEKQIALATNLIKFAKYRVESISDGWIQTCPKCHSVESGKIWRNSSSKCEQLVGSKKCGYKFESKDKVKTLVANSIG